MRQLNPQRALNYFDKCGKLSGSVSRSVSRSVGKSRLTGRLFCVLAARTTVPAAHPHAARVAHVFEPAFEHSQTSRPAVSQPLSRRSARAEHRAPRSLCSGRVCAGCNAPDVARKLPTLRDAPGVARVVPAAPEACREPRRNSGGRSITRWCHYRQPCALSPPASPP